MYSLLNETPEPLIRYKASVTDCLQRIIDKASAKDRSLRYQHIDELLADLRSAQRDTNDSKKYNFIGKSRRKYFLYTIASVLFIIILVIIIKSNLFSPSRQDAENINTLVQKPEESEWTNSVAVLPF